MTGEIGEVGAGGVDQEEMEVWIDRQLAEQAVQCRALEVHLRDQGVAPAAGGRRHLRLAPEPWRAAQ